MTLQQALDAGGPGAVIRLGRGTYREKVRVTHPNVTLLGEGPASVLSWGDAASTRRPDGSTLGTFESYTLLVTGDGFRAEGLTIENTAGPGDLVGQAVAAFVDADRAVFRDCRLVGRQDTLFTGPLPPAPLTAPSFGTAREILPRRPTRQYYERCVIEGDVDFVFGSATAVFYRCDLVSRARRDGGWITAASTPEGQPQGYLFLDCRLTGDAAPGSVWLGRPWRNHAKTVFVRCTIGAHVRPEGWHDWDKAAARSTAWFAEFASTGPGAEGPRASWAHALPSSQVRRLTVKAVLGGQDGWNPRSGAKPGSGIKVVP